MRTKNSSPNPSKKVSDLNLKQYEIRITAKLCVALIFTLHFVLRICSTNFDPTFTHISRMLSRSALLTSLLIPIIVSIEYFLFRRKGPAIIRFSKILDLILLLILMADWVVVILSGLYRIQQTNPPSFMISAGNAFTSFSWRTLIITLVIQKWYWKIIAPAVGTFLVAGFSVHYDPSNAAFLMVKAVIQVVCLILIFYCEDKIKWRLLWTNLKQEKWMEVHNFLLNNLPENIMILNFAGETKFISDYCKNFLKRYHLPLDDHRGFFKRIRDLSRQAEPDPPVTNNLYVERLTTGNGLLLTDLEDLESNSIKLETLDDLIMSFPSLIKEKNLQEREFFVYNGKLKNENPLVQDKSIEIKISFMQNSDNDNIILILRDTTQRDLLVTLEETNKYKDQLLASVSHELRAPLNGNINLVEGAINSPKIPDSLKETLLIPALQSSKVLLHIINDIIDMSQIKQKKLRLVVESGDPKETIKSTAQLVELQAKKKGIEFQVEIDHDLPKNFCTDHIRLSQIVLNLLSNAVKFTAKGKVKLIAARIQDTPWIRISVEDSGIGISPENVPKLSRANTWVPLEGESDGMGLGLSITSSLVELLAPSNHQNINVKSIPNQGSVFSFILENKQNIHQESDGSWEVAEEHTEPIQRLHSSNSKFQGFESSRSIPLALAKSDSEPLFKKCPCPKVLIVDDNPFNIMALETILTIFHGKMTFFCTMRILFVCKKLDANFSEGLNSLQIKSDSAYSGSAAIQKLLEAGIQKCDHKDCKQYNIIFMDQEMPEMNGADTVKEIKKLQKEKKISSNIKFIGCTAHKGKEEVDRFFAAGLDSCIYKPVSIMMIKDSLKGSLL